MQAHDAYLDTLGDTHRDAPRRDPAGLKVVPYRPGPPWPQHRARHRIFDPFRNFPYRAVHLIRMMDQQLAQPMQAHD